MSGDIIFLRDYRPAKPKLTPEERKRRKIFANLALDEAKNPPKPISVPAITLPEPDEIGGARSVSGPHEEKSA